MMTPPSSEHPPCIALTGASGFVGTHILQQLLDNGYHVKALQHHSKISDHTNLTVIKGSLSDPSSLNMLVKNTVSIIHCGGSVASKNKEGFFEANTKGTENIVKAAQYEGVKSFLYISSLAARTPQISPYAASKLAGEKILQTSTIESWDIIRPPAVYGPGDTQILPLMQLLRNRVGILNGGRQARVSVIYAEDLARAVLCWLASDTNKRHNKVYEIDDGQENGYSWQDLLDEAASAMNIRPFYMVPPRFLLNGIGHIAKFICRINGRTPFITPEKLRELSHPDWVCRDRSIEHSIDWRAQINFHEGITKTLHWYQEKGLLNNLNLRSTL